MGWNRGWAAAVLALLTACGGGGGGGEAPQPSSTGPRAPLPTVVQDLNPSGERLDYRSLNYFAGAPGDHWTLSQVDSGSTVTMVTRSASGAPDGDVLLSEEVLGQVESKRYRRTPEGLLSVAPLAGEVSDEMSQIVGNLLEYPEPFYPVGSTRRMVRQGTTGDDVDGDGLHDSFRLEVTQVLVGFESVPLFNGRVLQNAARFRNVWSLTLQGSDPQQPVRTEVFTEEAWWAPKIGLVQARRTVGAAQDATLAPTYTLTLSAATVAGRDVFGPDGEVTVVGLSHNALVHDPVRGRYYASMPNDGPVAGNRLGVIDPADGSITEVALTIGQDPFALALNADASALYVGVNGTGEVVKLRLPDFAEEWRVRLPLHPTHGQLLPEHIAVSPTEADTVAVSTWRTGASPRHTGVVLIRGGVVQPRATQELVGSNLLAFGPDGALFGLDTENAGGDLRRLSVLADGLQESQVVDLPDTERVNSLAVGPSGLVLDRSLYRTNDLSLAGQADVVGGGCRPAGNRIICGHRPPDGYLPGDAAVAILDAGTLSPLAKPIYYRGYEVLLLSEIVPGPAGQVALRMGAQGFGAASDTLLLFNSTQLP